MGHKCDQKRNWGGGGNETARSEYKEGNGDGPRLCAQHNFLVFPGQLGQALEYVHRYIV